MMFASFLMEKKRIKSFPVHLLYIVNTYLQKLYQKYVNKKYFTIISEEWIISK